MIGISPKFPLLFDNEVGAYSLNHTVNEAVKQNFKNLLLTAPGERIMDIKFGVGLRNFLFEQNHPSLHSVIAQKINDQKNMYMSFIALEEIKFNEGLEDIENQDALENILKVSIYYSLGGSSLVEVLEIMASSQLQLNL